MDRRPARIQAMFGSIAGSYDLLNHGLSLDRDRAWRRRAVEEAGDRGGGLVLDLCTGTADLAIALARAEPAPALVVGADFALPMLRLAAAKVGSARAAGAARIPLLAADALRLPFPAAMFDAATVAFGLRNLVDPRAGLAEMRRVLRPGGRAVVLEFHRPRNPLFRLLYETYFHLVLPLAGNLVSGSRDGAYGYLPRSVLDFPPPEAVAAMMREVGFGAVVTRPLDLGIVTLHAGAKA